MRNRSEHFESGRQQGLREASWEARIKALEDFRALLEGYGSAIRNYLRRILIGLAMAALGAVTATFPGSPLGHLASFVSQFLTGD